jgi:hypothetical protein
LHYKAETPNKTHGTKHHYGWLERTIEGLSGTLKVNLALLLRQVKSLTSLIADYDQHLEGLACSARYEKPVQALICYQGIKAIFALTRITESGDIKRFPHHGNSSPGSAWTFGSIPPVANTIALASRNRATACAHSLRRSQSTRLPHHTA